MKVESGQLPGVKLITPTLYEDGRGFFCETWNPLLQSKLELCSELVQDNHSRSRQGVLRGLHYQVHRPQGKLIRSASGSIFDVVVDLRRESPTLGQWQGFELSDSNHQMLWIPPGFAHGFLVTSATADVVYKCSEPYSANHQRVIMWNDPDLAIHWPLSHRDPLLSDQDRNGLSFRDSELF